MTRGERALLRGCLAVLIAFYTLLFATACVATPSRTAREGDYLTDFYLWDARGRCIHMVLGHFKVVAPERCEGE